MLYSNVIYTGGCVVYTFYLLRFVQRALFTFQILKARASHSLLSHLRTMYTLESIHYLYRESMYI